MFGLPADIAGVGGSLEHDERPVGLGLVGLIGPLITRLQILV